MSLDRWGVRSVVLFGLMVLAWGGNYLFVRVGEAYVAPLPLATFRAAVGAAGVAVYLGIRPTGAPLSPRDRRDALLLGIPNTGLFLALWFVAAPAIAPGEASIVIYTFPLWVALFSPSVLGTRLGGRHWLAIGTGFVGVALVSQPWTTGVSRASILPFVELLAAAVSWAISTVLFQRRFPQTKLARANAYQLAGGTALLVAVTGLTGQGVVPGPEPTLWLSVLWLGVFGTAFAYTVWFYLLETVHASALSAYAFLVPLVALALSAVFEGERLDLAQFVGVVLVLIGIGLVGRRPLASSRGAAVSLEGT